MTRRRGNAGSDDFEPTPDQKKAYDDYRKALNERKANYPCETCGRFYTTKSAADRCCPDQ